MTTGIINIIPEIIEATTIRRGKLQTPNNELHKILRFSIFPQDEIMVALVMKNNQAIAVTDASVFHDSTASTAWVIQCMQTHHRCEGRVKIPYLFGKMNSYRAESYGIYTILIAAQQLCQIHDIRSGSLTVACDNDNALKYSIEYSHRPPPRYKTFDILWAIHNLRKKLPTKIIPKRVKGHSDRLFRGQNIFETLNCEMDMVFADIKHISLSKLLHFMKTKIGN